MDLTKKNAWALAGVLGAAIAGTAVVQGCGGDDAAPTDTTTKDAGTTSTQVDSGKEGTTLSCAAPATQCGDKCVDTKHDPTNCGACGTACAAGLTCADGACALACSGGATKCGDACVDTDVDLNNCGACGTKCAAGEVCSNGACGLTCASPLATCGSGDAGAGATVDGGTVAQAFCANTQKDTANCGACGVSCAANETCVSGACSAGCSTAADCGSGAAKCVANKCVVPKDCSEIREQNLRAQSGVYTIDPDGAGGVAPFAAYCDMVTDGGGWTIVASYAGLDQEVPLVSDTEVAGNALTFAHSNLNRAKKIALSNISNETIINRKDGRWIIANKPMFSSAAGKDLSVANTDTAFATKVRTQDGKSADAFMGWSNYKITGGGDFGISVAPDGTTSCNTTTVSGFDHHSSASATTYYQLNCNCDRQYFFSYSSQFADGDASYKANTIGGAWTGYLGCNGNDGNGLAFYAAMRRTPTAVAQSCSALHTAQPTLPDGWYTIDPDGAGPKGALGVYCDMTTDGGGYTMLPILGGTATSDKNTNNTCKDLGLNMVVSRTQAHLSKLVSLWGTSFFATVPGVTGVAAGNYSTCAMNSGNATCAANWKALDNGAWFARSAAYGEPNGDYTAGCWLGWYGAGGVLDDKGATFNDNNCNYSTGTSYVCSDNAKP